MLREMRVRDVKTSDLQTLRAMAEASGYPYPDLESDPLVVVRVVVDDEDQPIMSGEIEQLWQAYLRCDASLPPHQRSAALRLLHEDMASCLREKGIKSVEAFLPPTAAQRFGRRLERTFGWTRNWKSWNKAF